MCPRKENRYSARRTSAPAPAVLLTLSLWLACLCMPDGAEAHRTNIFAWVEGDTVHTESKFSGGKDVQGAVIVVFDEEGNELLKGRTDDTGRFSFPVPATASGLRIVLEAGMGHRGEWRLSSAELGRTGQPQTPLSGGSGSAPVETVVPPLSQSTLSEERLRRIVDEALEEKLQPLFRFLAESRQDKTSFSDILGGIGYIVGLVGLAAYLRYRHTEKIRRPSDGATPR